MGWGVLGCGPNTTSLRVAGGMPGKPKRIRGCYNPCPSKAALTFFTSLSLPGLAGNSAFLLVPP